MTTRVKRSYVVCVSNEGYSASLEPRKVYRSLPDARGKKLGLVRVVDESGEDYLYPKASFGRVTLPAETARAMSI